MEAVGKKKLNFEREGSAFWFFFLLFIFFVPFPSDNSETVFLFMYTYSKFFLQKESNLCINICRYLFSIFIHIRFFLFALFSLPVDYRYIITVWI